MTTNLGIKQPTKTSTYGVNGNDQAAATTGVSGSSNVPVEQQSSSDTFQNNGTKEVENKTKRTLQELKSQLSALSTQLGINDDKTLSLISRIAGYSENELLNVEQEVLNKTIESVKAAIKDTQKCNNNDEYIEKIAKLAKDYNIALNTRWSIDGFKKYNGKNSEDINQRLIRTLGLAKDFDISNCSEAERKEVLHKYFNLYFENLKKDPNYKDKNIHKLQLQDFGKLLINSTDKEQKAAMDALKELYSDNKLPGFEALIRSFETEEERTKCANDLSYETIIGKDAEGNMVSDDDSTKFAVVKNQLSDKEGIEKSHKELNEMAKNYYNEHKELLDNIFSKKLNLEDLTPEEEQILKEFQQLISLQSGEIIGTANSTTISDRGVIDNLLKTMNYDAYQISENNYRNVLERTNQYTEEHQNELNISKEDFDKILNTVTNNNYSTVINDVKNGTTTKLNTPTPVKNPETPEAPTSDANNTSNRNYSTNPINNCNSNVLEAFPTAYMNYTAAAKTLQAKKEIIPYVLENDDKDVKYQTCKSELKLANTQEGRKQLIEKYGKAAYIKAAVTGTIIGAKQHALRLYEDMDKSSQLDVWNSADAATKIELLHYSLPEVILSMGRCSNEAINKLVAKEREEIKKNNPELYNEFAATCQA